MAIINETIERPALSVVQEVGHFATTLLSDAMEKSQTMHSEIKPVFRIDRVAGPAITARSMVADYLTPVAAIDYAQPGDVIVIDVRGYKDAAIWGDLAARSCKLRGIAAVVIDGAVRDSRGIEELQVPHFARAITPNAGDCSVLGDINIPVQCGGVVVNPGDIIVGDSDGVVVVPRARAEQIIARVKKQLEAEERLEKLMVQDGLTCFQALKLVVGEITPTVGRGEDIEIF